MTRIRRCDLCGQAESQATDRNSSFWTDTQGWAKIERDYQIPEQADMDLCPTCVAAISLMAAHGYAWSIECVDHHGVRVAPGNVERGPAPGPLHGHGHAPDCDWFRSCRSKCDCGAHDTIAPPDL